jgi:hypothetical protein
MNGSQKPAKKREGPITYRERAAYNEAGHAVARQALGLRVGRVTIKPDSKAGSAGSCSDGHALRREHDPESDSSDKNRLRMERDVQVLLAGHEAERRFAGRANHEGARDDRERAIDLLSFFEGDFYEKPGRGRQEGFRTYFRLLRIWSRRLATGRWNWLKVEAVARLLLEKETISGTRGCRGYAGSRAAGS